MSICAADNVVEALEAVRAGIDLWCFPGNEALVTDSGCGLCYVVESCSGSINVDWGAVCKGRDLPHTRRTLRPEDFRWVITVSTSALFVKKPIQ
jgi:hypothetical protein